MIFYVRYFFKLVLLSILIGIIEIAYGYRSDWFFANSLSSTFPSNFFLYSCLTCASVMQYFFGFLGVIVLCGILYFVTSDIYKAWLYGIWFVLLEIYTCMNSLYVCGDLLAGGVIGNYLYSILLRNIFHSNVELLVTLTFSLLSVLVLLFHSQFVKPVISMFFSNLFFWIKNRLWVKHSIICNSIQNQVVLGQLDKSSIIKKTITGANTSYYTTIASDYMIGLMALFDHDNKSEVKDLDQSDSFLVTSLESALRRYGIEGSVVNVVRGPVITLIAYKITSHTKVQKVLSLEDDLTMALEVMSIRIRAPIPGTSLVGFEIANKVRQVLQFRSIIESEIYTKSSAELPLIVGYDIQGNPSIYNLASMPHLLMAGTTGSGKSVCLHGMVIGLLGCMSPEKLRCIMIDPKRLELGYYAEVPHLLFPIIYDVSKAKLVLSWVIEQMEKRYELIAALRVRNITEYNQKVNEKLPYIVVIIDEFADLIMTGGKEIETKIVRIAQMARAAGIHMIIATQRPSIDVITGLIKVNFPSRVSLRVTSKFDSRTILDDSGAEKLLGKGDLLFLDSSSGVLHRLHAAYIKTPEIERFSKWLQAKGKPEYVSYSPLDNSSDDALALDELDVELYRQIGDFLDQVDEISTSLLQRKFRIGYNRAARMMDYLESQGKVLAQDGTKIRKIVR